MPVPPREQHPEHRSEVVPAFGEDRCERLWALTGLAPFEKPRVDNVVETAA
jgi:hypothetical protein